MVKAAHVRKLISKIQFRIHIHSHNATSGEHLGDALDFGCISSIDYLEGAGKERLKATFVGKECSSIDVRDHVVSGVPLHDPVWFW